MPGLYLLRLGGAIREIYLVSGNQAAYRPTRPIPAY